MKRLFLTTLLFGSVLCRAQSLVTISGAQISVSPGADVFIDGSISIEPNSNVLIDGVLTINGSVQSFGMVNQLGEMALTGNWSNNGTYTSADASMVRLIGVNQTLGGDSISHFGQVDCEISGIKELDNSITADKVDLGNSILNTHEFSVLVRNPAESSLSFEDARVISELNGQLRRNVNATGLYVFPIGDENARWQAEYQSISSTQVGLRYAAVDANTEGLSRFQVAPELCSLSDVAYVRFYDLPSPSGETRLRFPATINNDFPSLCKRDVGVAQSWSLALAEVAVVDNDTAVFTITPLSSNPAYILGRTRPQTPQIVGESVLCQNTLGSPYSLDSTGNNSLIWTVSGGEFTNQSNSSINVDWADAATGLVSVVATDPLGCTSLPGNLPIVLNPIPIASIGITPPALPFENEYFNFHSTTSSEIYAWQFESGQTYSDSSILHGFQAPGIYSVVLQVENEFGCTDTTQTEVEILEGLLISNVITPNGDGINDFFELPNSGIIEYQISIFNRWGVAVFESTESKSMWDGRDSAGNVVTPGTYFYVLQAKSALTDYSKKGSIQVIY